jgi:hypothetical protein
LTTLAGIGIWKPYLNATKNTSQMPPAQLSALTLRQAMSSTTTVNAPMTLEEAVHGAAHKLARLLDSTLGRLHDHRKKTSGLPLSGTDATNRSHSIRASTRSIS